MFAPRAGGALGGTPFGNGLQSEITARIFIILKKQSFELTAFMPENLNQPYPLALNSFGDGLGVVARSW